MLYLCSFVTIFWVCVEERRKPWKMKKGRRMISSRRSEVVVTLQRMLTWGSRDTVTLRWVVLSITALFRNWYYSLFKLSLELRAAGIYTDHADWRWPDWRPVTPHVKKLWLWITITKELQSYQSECQSAADSSFKSALTVVSYQFSIQHETNRDKLQENRRINL